MKSVISMTGYVLMLVLLVLVCACGKETNEKKDNKRDLGSGAGVSDSVYGTWGGFPSLEMSTVKFGFQLNIEPRMVTSIVKCDYTDGSSLTTRVSSRADIAASKIKILEKQAHTTYDGSKSCQSSIDPGEMDYELDGDRLILTKNGEESITLHRVR